MRVGNLKKYFGGDPKDYLGRLPYIFTLLETAFRKIAFKDNFEGFVVEGVRLPAGTETAIRNQSSFVPTQRVILRQKGGGAIIDGDRTWTDQTVYLQNTGTDEAIVTVLFTR